ncbi:MAG TPA: MerC domain-containing protein [Rhodanobacteraceae bacterium]|nr:MerC domain-containing protein [Rhodanobacteraceae bacterium]
MASPTHSASTADPVAAAAPANLGVAGRSGRGHAWHRADRLGAGASLLCAIHCALLPLVIGLLPLVGLEILADRGVEFAFVLCACALASTTVIRGWRVHGDPGALRLLLPGIALLLVGQALGHGSSTELAHAAVMACGGTIVASAHVLNLRRMRRIRRA